jgi:SAM-dependent methyltransferase
MDRMNLLGRNAVIEHETATSSKRRRADSTLETPPLRPFGRLGAARYDDDTKEMPRRYHTAHALQNGLVLNALKASRTPRPVIVDFGCGTGNDGLSLLSRSDDFIYFGIDYSIHMLSCAAAKLKHAGYDDRSLLLNRNFLRLNQNELLTALEAAGHVAEIFCVISAISLHYYDKKEKEAVYKLIFGLLPKGGLFVLSDLYSNGIDYCADWAWSKELLDINNAVKRLESRNREAHRGPSTISERHYREENRPQILAQELSLLSEIGFGKIDVVYRNGQLGVLAIEK